MPQIRNIGERPIEDAEGYVNSESEGEVPFFIDVEKVLTS